MGLPGFRVVFFADLWRVAFMAFGETACCRSVLGGQGNWHRVPWGHSWSLAHLGPLWPPQWPPCLVLQGCPLAHRSPLWQRSPAAARSLPRRSTNDDGLPWLSAGWLPWLPWLPGGWMFGCWLPGGSWLFGPKPGCTNGRTVGGAHTLPCEHVDASGHFAVSGQACAPGGALHARGELGTQAVGAPAAG